MNKEALKLAHSLAMIYRKFANKRFNKLKEHVFDTIYGKWDTDMFIESRNLLFNLITGEKSFEAFYDRFEAPALAKGNKPIAWDPRFIPDMIDDVIWNDESLSKKVKEINRLYKKCIELEKGFKKK